MNRINSLSKLICVAISDRAVIGVFESAVVKVPFCCRGYSINELDPFAAHQRIRSSVMTQNDQNRLEII